MVWKQHNFDNDNRNNRNSKRDSVDGSEIPFPTTWDVYILHPS